PTRPPRLPYTTLFRSGRNQPEELVVPVRDVIRHAGTSPEDGHCKVPQESGRPAYSCGCGCSGWITASISRMSTSGASTTSRYRLDRKSTRLNSSHVKI